MYKSLFYALSLTVMASSVMASNEESLEKGFLEVKPTSSCLNKLFPEKFSADQVSTFFAKKDVIVEEVGTLAVDDVFYGKICPNSLQMLTGTASSYASKIQFAQQAHFKEGGLVGLYEYTSSYSSLYAMSGYAGSITFPIKLQLEDGFVIYNKHLIKEGPCDVLNLKDSFLGRDVDFVSKPSQFDGVNIPEASIFYMICADEKFFSETGNIRRLQFNAKTYLLMLDQLRGVDHFNQSQEDRDADAEKLYTSLLEKKKLVRDDQTAEQYVSVMLGLRKKILKQLGIPMNLVPNISNEDFMKVASGKGLLVLPAPDDKVVNIKDD